MYTANYILVPVLIFLILLYIYGFVGYIHHQNTIFKQKKNITTSCVLNDCDKNYYLSQSLDQ